jgi:hypothetical protein
LLLVKEVDDVEEEVVPEEKDDGSDLETMDRSFFERKKRLGLKLLGVIFVRSFMVGI